MVMKKAMKAKMRKKMAKKVAMKIVRQEFKKTWKNVLASQQDAEEFVESCDIGDEDESFEIAQELAKDIFDAAIRDILQMLKAQRAENSE